MEDVLYLKMAGDSLEKIYSSLRLERSTIESIVEHMLSSDQSSETNATVSFLQRILGKLVTIDNQLKPQLRKVRNLRLNAIKNIPGDRYSDERLAKHRQINDMLVAVEKRIKKDFKRLLPQCEQMQKDGIIDDFEIESEVSIWLDESDPAYRDDDDNILAVSSYNAKVDADTDFGLDDGKNHNEAQHFEGHPIQKEHYCWLFHELYDHSHLWDEILRMDMIWLDTTVRYQNFYYLSKSQKEKKG